MTQQVDQVPGNLTPYENELLGQQLVKLVSTSSMDLSGLSCPNGSQLWLHQHHPTSDGNWYHHTIYICMCDWQMFFAHNTSLRMATREPKVTMDCVPLFIKPCSCLDFLFQSLIYFCFLHCRHCVDCCARLLHVHLCCIYLIICLVM